MCFFLLLELVLYNRQYARRADLIRIFSFLCAIGFYTAAAVLLRASDFCIIENSERVCIPRRCRIYEFVLLTCILRDFMRINLSCLALFFAEITID